MINYQHQKGAQCNFLDVSTGMEREKAGRLVKSLARLYIKTWSQDRHWVLRRYFRLVLPQWHQNLVFLGLSTMKWNSWLLLLPFPYHCRVATMLEWWAIICIRCISLRLVLANWKPPRKKGDKAKLSIHDTFLPLFFFHKNVLHFKASGQIRHPPHMWKATCPHISYLSGVLCSFLHQSSYLAFYLYWQYATIPT